MHNRDDGTLDFADVESMIRDAAGYIEVSADLRPKTLELARERKHEATGRFWIELVAVAVIVLALSTPAMTRRLSTALSLDSDLTADAHTLFSRAQQKSIETSDDVSWSLVDAFRELRQRQSSVIDEVF